MNLYGILPIKQLSRNQLFEDNRYIVQERCKLLCSKMFLLNALNYIHFVAFLLSFFFSRIINFKLFVFNELQLSTKPINSRIEHKSSFCITGTGFIITVFLIFI